MTTFSPDPRSYYRQIAAEDDRLRNVLLAIARDRELSLVDATAARLSAVQAYCDKLTRILDQFIAESEGGCPEHLIIECADCATETGQS